MSEVLVDKMVGSAYETVRLVAQHIEYVRHVSAHLAQIYRVSGSIDKLDLLTESLAALENIQTQIDPLLALYTNMDKIEALAASIDLMTSVSGALSQLEALQADIDSIQALLPYVDQLIDLGNSVDAINSISTNMTQLLYIYNNMPALLAEVATVSSYESRLATVEAVQNNGVTVEQLGTALALKADKTTTNTLTDSLNTTIANLNSLTSNFNTHGHPMSAISGLQTALAGKQAVGNYAVAGHGHIIEDVSGLQAALDGKQVAGSYAAAAHNHDGVYLPVAGGIMTGELRMQSGNAVVTDNGALSITKGGAGIPWVALFNRASDSGTMFLFQRIGNNCGSITVGPGTTAYNTSSDKRIKTNIVAAPDYGKIIDAVEVVEFTMIEDPDAIVHKGFLAQDLHEQVPTAVTIGSGEPGDKDFEPWSVDLSKLVPVMWKEIQSLRSRLSKLEG